MLSDEQLEARQRMARILRELGYDDYLVSVDASGVYLTIDVAIEDVLSMVEV